MGKYSKGILGPFAGKIGTVVGSSWNGIEYMRSLPKRSSKTPSEAQTVHRAKFGMANGFLGPIMKLLNRGFKASAFERTGFNVAVSALMAEALTGTYPDFIIDYSKVRISEGHLTGIWNVTVNSEQPAELSINWPDNTGTGTAKGTDKAVIVVYNPAKSQYSYNLETGAERSEGSDTLILPSTFSGDTVEVWMAFMTANKGSFSTSIYVGQVLVA